MSDDKAPDQAAVDQSPENVPAPAGEVRQVGVREGMFGSRGTGDTSGYGGLTQAITYPGDAQRPYGGWFDEVAVGETFDSAVTITDAHLVLGAGYVADFNPLHVNEEFAKKSRFGTRILHGPFTSALVSAPIGNYFAGTWNVPGTFDLTLTAVDANGTTATQTLVFTVK